MKGLNDLKRTGLSRQLRQQHELVKKSGQYSKDYWQVCKYVIDQVLGQDTQVIDQMRSRDMSCKADTRSRHE